VSYEEEDTCVSYEEEDTCVSYEEEDTCVSYEEEDTCVCVERPLERTGVLWPQTVKECSVPGSDDEP
jgi:hypothetical protein